MISRHCSIAIFISFALHGLVGCAPRDDAPLDTARDGVFAGYSPARELGCSYQSASLSPDGSMAVFLDSDAGGGNSNFIAGFSSALRPDRSAIVGTACLLAEQSLPACQIGTIAAGPTAQGARAWWSVDSQHVFMNSGGRVGAFVIDRATNRISLVDEPREHRFMRPWTIAVVGPTPSRTRTDEWKRIRAAEKWFASVRNPLFGQGALSSMRVTLGLHGMAASGTISDSMELGALRSAADGVEKTGHLVTVFMGEERPMLLQDERGSDWLVGMGEALRRQRASNGSAFKWAPGPRSGLYGKRPILDSATGRLLGVHTERDIAWVYPDADLEALRVRLLATLPSSALINQITMSRSAGVAVAISFTRGVEGGHTVLRRAPNGLWRGGYARCAAPSTDGPVGVAGYTYDAGEPGWPVMARIERREGNRRLLVFLHGGPGRTVLYGGAFTRAAPLERYDQVSYDPSGTIGVDAAVAERISRFGGEALERDARLIVADVKRLARSYDKVVLYAVSFGGALVPAVASGLGDVFDRAHLAAPLAYHHHPLSNERERVHAKKNKVSESFSLLFHDLHFGNRRNDGRQPFDSWLAAQYRSFTLDERFTVVQGSKDELSRPGDIPKPGRARMLVVDGGHMSATTLEHVCWLYGPCLDASVGSIAR